MAKVTSKLQVTIPKAIAERYRIAPGQEVEWLAAGDAIRVVPQGSARDGSQRGRRLEIYDRATSRQRARETDGPITRSEEGSRGWTREDLYERGAG